MRINKSLNFLAFVVYTFAVVIGFAYVGSGLMSLASRSAHASPILIGKIETNDLTQISALSAAECQEVLLTYNGAGHALSEKY